MNKNQSGRGGSKSVGENEQRQFWIELLSFALFTSEICLNSEAFSWMKQTVTRKQRNRKWDKMESDILFLQKRYLGVILFLPTSTSRPCCNNIQREEPGLTSDEVKSILVRTGR